MEFAFSTVLGGMPVYATDCTYEDTIELLTTCPICSSAVHLRSAADQTYKKSGKTIVSNPYFAHYKAGSADDYKCTARCKASSGQQLLQQRLAHCKGQRLKWYNDRLWEAAKADRKLRTQQLIEVIKILEIGRIRSAAKMFRKSASRWRHANSLEIDRVLDISNLEKSLKEYKPSKEDYDQAIAYFRTVDRRLHADICKEILDFLATPSGGYALEKIIPATLWKR
jgi:hypothetical protein